MQSKHAWPRPTRQTSRLLRPVMEFTNTNSRWTNTERFDEANDQSTIPIHMTENDRLALLSKMYDEYSISQTTSNSTSFVPRYENSLLHKIKIQMMYIVHSQRGSPALFTVQGWLVEDNAKWFHELKQSIDEFNTGTVLTQDGYQVLDRFDDILRVYNQELVSQNSTSAIVGDILYKGLSKGWSPPKPMRWVLVPVENHSLVIWAGPHRVTSQPGSATYMYLHPERRESLIHRAHEHLQLHSMLKELNAKSSNLGQIIHPTVLESNTDLTFYDEKAHAKRLMDELHNDSFAIFHYVQDTHLTQSYDQVKKRLELLHTIDPHYHSPLDNACATIKCCYMVTPLIQAIWHSLYKDIPDDRLLVAFPPTRYVRYEDNGESESFPPHIDFAAVFV